MKKILLPVVLCASCVFSSLAQSLAQVAHAPAQNAVPLRVDSLLPVRGLCIGIPRPSGVDSFVQFIDKELAPRQINTLFLMIDYHYQFKSHPELIDSFAISEQDAKKIVRVCAANHIRIIPEMDMLGHQGWEERPGKLLQVYPQFDETPWVKNPVKYEWPNPDNLYCRSYCPLAPGLHEILFGVIDEICDVFESNAFHAGMDEVFYLGEDRCPRCAGKDKAVLFAGEVKTLRNHLAGKGRELWIWGDRLLDGKTTGLGIWEASGNDTYRAIDLIPKDVVICDWHYDRPDKTSVLFAMKGLRVVTCPWRHPLFAVTQVNDMVAFREQSTPEMRACFMGVVETVWQSNASFMQGFYGILPADPLRPRRESGDNTAWNTLKAICTRIGELSQ